MSSLRDRPIHRALAIRRPIALCCLALCVVLVGAGGHEARGQIAPIAWVELGPGGTPIARVITGGACPTVALPAGAVAMSGRARASAAFAVQVCEAMLPAGTTSAAVGGTRLPLPDRPIRRIAVVGDTGCRVSGEGATARAQACHDPREWSFSTIAASAAAWRPNLVIHVGDLLYRESECPAGNAGCNGDPWGFRWATFNADFFVPAAPLLRAAPWVFVRGNHENCDRDGEAWFRFLDPRPFPGKCLDYTEPYAVTVGGLQLLVLDSGRADDSTLDPEHLAPYSAQFAALRRLSGSNAWILTHIPMWGVRLAGQSGGQERVSFDHPLLQAASQNSLPSGVKLVLAGHIHLFEFLSFTPPRPPQIVVGNGGTTLAVPVTTPLTSLTIAGAQVTAGRVMRQFGFLTMEGAGTNWTATLRDTEGMAVLTCALRDIRLSCPP